MLELQKTPYNRFFSILFLQNTPNDQIRLGFQRRKLMVPTDQEIEERRLEFWQLLPDTAKEFYKDRTALVDLKEAPDDVKECLRIYEVSQILKSPKAYTEARGFFDQTDVRSLIFTHVIAQKSEREIKETLEYTTKYPVDLDTIILFKHIFCNRSDMDYKSWKEWVYALRKVSFLESDLYTLSFSNRYPFELVKWKMHAKIDAPDPDKLIESFVSFLYYKSLEAIEGAAAEEFEIVNGWMERFLKAYEKHKVLGKGKHLDAKGPLDEAIFMLDRSTKPKKNVLDLGEHVTKVQGPILLADLVPTKTHD